MFNRLMEICANNYDSDAADGMSAMQRGDQRPVARLELRVEALYRNRGLPVV
jgi:hypothetical protein